MKKVAISFLLFISICLIACSEKNHQQVQGKYIPNKEVQASPNGLYLPKAYRDWNILSASYRKDNHTLRYIFGNDIAVKASREGKTSPWPDGAILGKVVLKVKNDENWDAAIVPKKIGHAEFMYKDSKKYKETEGWGYARWVGNDQKPYGKDKSFVQECYQCHLPVKNNDFVFTHPVTLPE